MLGDDASLETHLRVRRVLGALLSAHIPGVVGLHPAYASILVDFDPAAVDAAGVERGALAAVDASAAGAPVADRLVEVPVSYEEPSAPDLAEVARIHGISATEVASIHAAGDYRVHFLGFVPGFPYLGGLSPRIATPRLAVPRRRVPAGSVAIGGEQTGIYPLATPGGWRLIGRTPLRLFVPDRDPPSLLEIGDRVRFVPVPAAALAGGGEGR